MSSKLKIGDKVRVIKYDDMYKVNGKIAKVVTYNSRNKEYGLDFGIGNGSKGHTLASLLPEATGLWISGDMKWELLIPDNSLNRLLYPEHKPDGEGNLI